MNATDTSTPPALPSTSRTLLMRTATDAVDRPGVLFGAFYDALAETDPDGDCFGGVITPRPDRLVRTIAQTLSTDEPASDVRASLRRFGAQHRLLGTAAHHYTPVGTAMLAALRTSLGQQWDSGVETLWRDAYALVTDWMLAGVPDGEAPPPVWKARITRRIPHDDRTATVVLRPDSGYPPHDPGQHLALALPGRTSVRRLYSIANLPRQDGELHLLVRRVRPGGVSAWLVEDAQQGDEVLLHAPHGSGTAAGNGGPVLCVAGGIGVAPMRGLVETIVRSGPGDPVTLFYGARTRPELVMLADLQALSREYGRLSVVPVLSRDPAGAQRVGAVPGGLPQAVFEHPATLAALAEATGAEATDSARASRVHVAGSPRLMRAVVTGLLDRGLPSDRLRFDVTHM